MSDYFNLGLDDVSLSGGSEAATSGSSSLGEFWGGVKDFLNDGISVAGDLAGIKTAWNDAWNDDYSNQYQPADEQQLSNLNSAAKVGAVSGEWVSGVPNGVVLLGAGAAVLGLLALAKGGK